MLAEQTKYTFSIQSPFWFIDKVRCCTVSVRDMEIYKM